MKQRFYIYTSGYNASKWVAKCIESVDSQTYSDFHHVIVDDASTDNTYAECQRFANDKRTIIRNTANLKWLHSATLHCKPADEDVVVILDLDDWLASANVLSILNDVYMKEQCWLTYGDYSKLSSPGPSRHCKPFPPKVLADRSFRTHSFIASHLRTFKGKLWNSLKPEWFKDWDGNFADMAYDCAIMFPLLERCRPGKIRFINEVLYIYNDGNPISDCRRSRDLQKKTHSWFAKMPKVEML